MRRSLQTVALLSALLMAVSPASASVMASGRASGLPDRLGLGVAAAPDDTGLTGWMPGSGVPWDYAYQYLAAGVNTGSGWQTWNDQAQFPLWYAQSAYSRGYIPVFPYYMLLQSTGACDTCAEAQKDLSHLNDATLMNAYYDDFAKLMKRLGTGTYDGIQGFGRTAVVHVEPDLSGYANQAVLDNAMCFGFCTGAGNDPTLLKASVASSGYSDAAGFADTYKGFSLVLAHIRDLYAPNVLLAFHVSSWATLFDAGSNTDASWDVRAQGQKAASFAIAAGVGAGYSIVFNDVADRDAGFYKTVLGQDTWWDRSNVTLPNFHQWETYMRGVRDRTNAPFVIWQIPVGNQIYRTMNNTDGHYQDNRVEYFFAHTSELTSLGIVGLLFGAGADGPTHQFDFKHDGVTNPPSLCTADGVSSGQICNANVSSSSDDDGGYLREIAAAFYQGSLPPPLPSVRVRVSITASASSVRHRATVSFWGAVVPNQFGKRIGLQFLDGRTRMWRTAVTTILGSGSGYRITFRRLLPGYLLFRTIFLRQDPNHLGNVSRTVRVTWL